MYIKLSAREMKTEFKLKYGGLAQLVEHLPCTQGVSGSNPLSSTKKRLKSKDLSLFLCKFEEY